MVSSHRAKSVPSYTLGDDRHFTKSARSFSDHGVSLKPVPNASFTSRSDPLGSLKKNPWLGNTSPQSWK